MKSLSLASRYYSGSSDSDSAAGRGQNCQAGPDDCRQWARDSVKTLLLLKSLSFKFHRQQLELISGFGAVVSPSHPPGRPGRAGPGVPPEELSLRDWQPAGSLQVRLQDHTTNKIEELNGHENTADGEAPTSLINDAQLYKASRWPDSDCSKIDSGYTAWMISSTALVLFMTASWKCSNPSKEVFSQCYALAAWFSFFLWRFIETQL